MIPFSEDTGQTTAVADPPKSELRQKEAEEQLLAEPAPSFERAPPLLELTTLFCTRFAAQRGISEGELVHIMTSALQITVSEVWPILRAWVEAGMLDVLSDPQWRARVYFARTPAS